MQARRLLTLLYDVCSSRDEAALCHSRVGPARFIAANKSLASSVRPRSLARSISFSFSFCVSFPLTQIWSTCYSLRPAYLCIHRIEIRRSFVSGSTVIPRKMHRETRNFHDVALFLSVIHNSREFQTTTKEESTRNNIYPSFLTNLKYSSICPYIGNFNSQRNKPSNNKTMRLLY